MVGGIAGYEEETRPRMKTYREFREELNLFLEKKNTKKKRSRNPGTVESDPRSQKIKKLKMMTPIGEDLNDKNNTSELSQSCKSGSDISLSFL